MVFALLSLQTCASRSWAIWNGSPVATCAWPTVVAVGRDCSGTLIHPELVVYAAHCGTDIETIAFGESRQAPAREVRPLECGAVADYQLTQGNDFAFCRLPQPQQLPIVPAIADCEMPRLRRSLALTIVGFGQNAAGLHGIKHSVDTPLRCVTPAEELFLGDSEGDSCAGDSGGPAFVRLNDGPAAEWRFVGIASYGAACGQGGYYVSAAAVIRWLETETGLRVSCFNPSDPASRPAHCDAAPSSPELGWQVPAGQAGWEDSCRASVYAPAALACDGGPADVDVAAPQIRFSHPTPGMRLQADLDGLARVTVSLQVEDDPHGCGSQRVRLFVDGHEKAAGAIHEGLSETKLKLRTGQHTLSAVAIDLAHNTSEEAAIEVAVTDPGLAGCRYSASPQPDPTTWIVLIALPLARKNRRNRTPRSARNNTRKAKQRGSPSI